MLLNATFIVQIIHFAIAYVLLDKFLFKQAIGQVLEEERQDQQLQALIEREQGIVYEKETAKAKSWQYMRRRFQEGAPVPLYRKKEEIKIIEEKPMHLPVLSEKEKEQYNADIVNFLKMKVEHVH